MDACFVYHEGKLAKSRRRQGNARSLQFILSGTAKPAEIELLCRRVNDSQLVAEAAVELEELITRKRFAFCFARLEPDKNADLAMPGLLPELARGSGIRAVLPCPTR